MNTRLIVAALTLAAALFAAAMLAGVAAQASDGSAPHAAHSPALTAPVVLQGEVGGGAPTRGPLSPKPPVSEEAKQSGKTTAIVLVIVGIVVILPLILAGMRRKT